MRLRSLIVFWLVLMAFQTGTLATKPAELVDVNRAPVAELMQVPGMTAPWAARIVRFRPYRTKRDLLDQGVVTTEVYRRIRDKVVAHHLDNSSVGTEQRHP